MEQALSELKVLDLTQHIAGPYCTKLLADYGADVIKIEKPGEGDSTRRMGPFPDDIPHPEKSGLFLHLNTNKRSITLNLKSSTGRKIFLELAKDADVIIESFRPGVMASFGLNYEVVRQINPRVIMASISNFGQTGPYRDYKASDVVLSGITGEMYSSGQPDREPLKFADAAIQYGGGYLALVGILAAVLVTQWQGIGQYLDLSLMQLIETLQDGRARASITYQFTGDAGRRVKNEHSLTWPPTGNYPCVDGYMCWTGLGKWRNVCQMIGRPDMITDPRYATPEARRQHAKEIQDILSPWMMERTKKESWAAGMAAGVLCGPCNTADEVVQDPHLRGRNFWAEVKHPVMGKITIPGRPFIMSETPWQLRRPAPLLGEHNEEVLSQLGYSREDLVRMREAGAV
ncbi:MAG: CoA transferase [Chloroflexi bacterium]|nr:CoA transferase [Chloroflexota bacterium]